MTTETQEQTETEEQSAQSTDSLETQDSQDTPPKQDQSSDDSTGDQSSDTQGDVADQGGSDEEYDLEISDESPLTEEDLNEIAEQAGRLRLSKEEAVKLIEAKEKAYNKGAEKIKSDFQAKIDQARKEIMADPIFAPDVREKTFQSMHRAIETFGDEQMVELIKSPEFGNNVVLARFLKRLGDVLAPASEDNADVTGGKGSSGKSQQDSNESLKSLYPDFFKQDQK